MIESINTYFADYSWVTAIVHISFAIIMFFIINWLGSKSVSIGYVQMSMIVKDDSYPAFNFLFKAIAPVVFMVLFVSIVQSLNFRPLVSHCYLLVVYYWLFRVLVIILYGRITLTNWKTQFLYWGTSIGVSFYLYKIIDRVDAILPNPETLRDQMWILIILFLYSIFNKMVFERSNSKKRKENYIKSTYSRFYSKYNKVISQKCDNNYFFIQMAYSIMIYENFNRPRFVRMMEYVHFLFSKKTHTLGIMQVTSLKWINDEQSISLAIKKITSDCNDIINAYARDKESFSLITIVRTIAAKYNKDEDYVSEVEEVFTTITDEEKASYDLLKKIKKLKLKCNKIGSSVFHFSN